MGTPADRMTRHPAMRPWIAVIGSVVSFALLVESAGLIPAVVVSVVVGSRGSPLTNIREAIAFGIGMAVAMSILFVGLLGQPMALVARFWP